MSTNFHTPISASATNDIANYNAPIGEIDSELYDVETGAKAITPDINGGTVDGATIGGTSAGAGTFSTLTASGSLTTSAATMSFGGKLYAHRGGVAQTIAHNTATTVQFNTEGLDESNWYNTGTYRYTPQIAGYYEVHAQIHWATAVDATVFIVQIEVNGGGIAFNYIQASGTGEFSQQVQAWYNMNGSSDYFTIGCSQQSGGNRNIDGNSQLSWVRIKRIG